MILNCLGKQFNCLFLHLLLVVGVGLVGVVVVEGGDATGDGRLKRRQRTKDILRFPPANKYCTESKGNVKNSIRGKQTKHQ